MTASKLVTIFCDEPSCGEWEDRGVADTAAGARRNLTGWATGLPGGYDYCPRHLPPVNPPGQPTQRGDA